MVIVCAVTSVVTFRDRAEVVAEEEASLTRTGEAARGMATDLSRVVTLVEELREVREQGAVDGRAAGRDAVVADTVLVLRVRLAQAQDAILASREVSAGQRAQLDVLSGCVRTLDRVRSTLAGDDIQAATVVLAAGRDACRQAEEVVDGIVDAVHPFDFPDPDVIEVDGTYYAYGTNGPGGAIQVLSTTDLADWQVRGPALTEVAPWGRRGQTWAPAVLRTFTGYLLYYTVRHAQWGTQCLSVATASTPTGPFVDASRAPLTCQTDFGGSIDPSPYIGEDGTPYLTWKSEGETVGGRAILWAARLDRAGTGIVGPSVPLLTSDRPWEGTVVEAPTMARIDGTWILLYSGNDWRTGRYATGYARCLGPLGPCAKPEANVVLSSGDRAQGPGGLSVFRTIDGATMAAYAAWGGGRVGPPHPRRLYLARLHLTPATLTAS